LHQDAQAVHLFMEWLLQAAAQVDLVLVEQ
jgi:hypothetical protein